MSDAKHYTRFDQSSYHAAFDIEITANPFPMSEGLFKSCIGGRYFNRQIEMGGEVLGFYLGDQVLDEITLTEICVAPKAQGQGLGKLLLNDFLTECKARSAAKVFLEVRASNTKAQMLYINHDFIQIDRRTAYYPSEYGFEDAIVMCRQL